MTKWEYRLAHTKHDKNTITETWLNAQGAEGWELIAFDHNDAGFNLVFKRPVAVNDGWINVSTGVTVAPDTVVTIRKRNGENEIGRYEQFRWSDTGSPYDIIAYRVG